MSEGYPGRYSDKLIEQVHDAVKEQGELLVRVSVLGESTQKDIARINGNVAELWKAHSRLENRTTALEKWRSYIVGAYTAAIAGLGLKWGVGK